MGLIMGLLSGKCKYSMHQLSNGFLSPLPDQQSPKNRSDKEKDRTCKKMLYMAYSIKGT